MVNLIRTFILIYKAMKTLNKENDEGHLQVYNGVENEDYLYFVVSKKVCKQYGLNAEVQFIKHEENKDE